MAQKAVLPGKKTHLKKNLDKKAIDNEPKAPYSEKIDKEDPALTADERAILTALGGSKRLVDDVIAETGLTAGKVLAAMTMLELKNVLSRLPGKRVALK